MSCPAEVELCVVRGDVLRFSVTIQDSAGSPIDLTGSTAAMQVRESPDATTVLATAITAIPTPANGKIDLELVGAETAAFDFARVSYDVEVTDSGGEATTYVYGWIRVIKDTTR